MLDTAPATVGSDTNPLMTPVDGVVVVSRLGHTVRDHARRLRQQLDHLDAPPLGIVVNSVQDGELYDYPYGYDAPPPTPKHHTNGARAGTRLS